MLTPGSTTQAFTISDLTPVADPLLELTGALHEVETPTGPNQGFENKKLTSEQLVSFLTTKLGAGGRTLSAVTLNVDAQVGNKYQLSPDLVTVLTALDAAGKKPVWIIPDAGAAARTTIYAKNFNVLPSNTAAANAAGVDAMRTSLLGQ
jgi:hypothetical protein